ncbi:hypothetical protein QQF64_024531 [Cirrhinus molitorella]|uniref:Uncharacterized protein n=1 Tax=Cirrhinus molitorella TaxID=172907 RepID=A0ABR3NLI2_9TELE
MPACWLKAQSQCDPVAPSDNFSLWGFKSEGQRVWLIRCLSKHRLNVTSYFSIQHSAIHLLRTDLVPSHRPHHDHMAWYEMPKQEKKNRKKKRVIGLD